MFNEKLLENITDENFSKPLKKNYETIRTRVLGTDDTWCLDLLDLNYYRSEKNTCYRYDSVAIDNFSKFRWTIPIENRKAQTKSNSFDHIFLSNIAKRKLQSFDETDDRKAFVNKFFQNY